MNARTLTTKDDGVSLQINLGFDASRFATVSLLLLSPAAVKKTVVCALDPLDPCMMIFTIPVNTFDEVGAWIAQALLEEATETLYGSEFEYLINAPID